MSGRWYDKGDPDVFPVESLDVSHWQGVIDWVTFHAWNLTHNDARVTFVWPKATEGNWRVDPQLGHNLRWLKELGYRRGAYHWMSPTAKVDATRQADWFTEAVSRHGWGPDDIPVLDWEQWGSTPDDVLAWSRRIEFNLGTRPAVYTGAAFMGRVTRAYPDADYESLAGHALFYARYRTTEPPPLLLPGRSAGDGAKAPFRWEWALHQWRGSGNLASPDRSDDGFLFPGIPGICDVNRVDWGVFATHFERDTMTPQQMDTLNTWMKETEGRISQRIVDSELRQDARFLKIEQDQAAKIADAYAMAQDRFGQMVQEAVRAATATIVEALTRKEGTDGAEP